MRARRSTPCLAVLVTTILACTVVAGAPSAHAKPTTPKPEAWELDAAEGIIGLLEGKSPASIVNPFGTAIAEWYMKVDATRLTVHSSNLVAPQAPNTPETQLVGRASFVIDARKAKKVKCGANGDVEVLCANGMTETLGAGKYLYVTKHFAGDFPSSDTTHTFQYSVGFDQDGVSANNWTGSASFPNDFYLGEDRVYELDKSPVTQWTLNVVDLTNNQRSTPPSQAVAVVYKTIAGVLIPMSKITSAHPSYRVTAFEHTGDFGLKGGPWSGALDPTAHEPLAPFGAGVFTISSATKGSAK